jgi:hypothetical protein
LKAKEEMRKMSVQIPLPEKDIIYKGKYYGCVDFPYDFEIDENNLGVAIIIRDQNGKRIARIWIK